MALMCAKNVPRIAYTSRVERIMFTTWHAGMIKIVNTWNKIRGNPQRQNVEQQTTRPGREAALIVQASSHPLLNEF